MRPFDAKATFVLGTVLGGVEAIRKQLNSTEPVPERDKVAFSVRFAAIHEQNLRANGLASSADGFLRIKKALEAITTPPTYVAILELLQDVQRRIIDDLGRPRFVCVDSADQKYYEESGLFGEPVSKAFPSIAWDLEEAGKCRALDRATACVFHLMRIVEVGLYTVAKSLGLRKPEERSSWQTIINDLQAPMKAKLTNRRWKKRNEEFYAGVLADISALKIATRNPTMHVRGKYTPEEARRIWGLTEGLMRHLAARLKER